MPTEILYSIIVGLFSICLALGGLWVRAHDQHRQWTTEKLNEHGKLLAILDHDFAEVRKDIAEIKLTVAEHLESENRFQRAVARKFELQL